MEIFKKFAGLEVVVLKDGLSILVTSPGEGEPFYIKIGKIKEGDIQNPVVSVTNKESVTSALIEASGAYPAKIESLKTIPQLILVEQNPPPSGGIYGGLDAQIRCRSNFISSLEPRGKPHELSVFITLVQSNRGIIYSAGSDTFSEAYRLICERYKREKKPIELFGF